MRRLCLLASLLALAVGAWSAPSGVAADACDDSAVVDVLPLHGEFGINHKINLVLLPKFELNRLVSNSIMFHVAVPGKPALELQGGNDSLGASFTPDTIGTYYVSARWRLRGCADRNQISDRSSETVPFKVYRERKPAPRFRATIPVDRTSKRAPIFAADAACPPSTIRVTEPLTLTVYWELGARKAPTRRSKSSSVTLSTGCGGRPSRSKTRNYRWGVVRGATIGVLPGHTVRVLGEVKSGKTIVGQTRVRFIPVADRVGFVRDKGRCTGGCVKRIYPY
jgi:hypothetical protein